MFSSSVECFSVYVSDASENRGLLELGMLPPSLLQELEHCRTGSVLLACVVFALWNPGSFSCKLCVAPWLFLLACTVHSSTIYYILVCVKWSRNSAVISKTIFSTVGVRLWRRQTALIYPTSVAWTRWTGPFKTPALTAVSFTGQVDELPCQIL